jgi:hypothetical protein
VVYYHLYPSLDFISGIPAGKPFITGYRKGRGPPLVIKGVLFDPYYPGLSTKELEYMLGLQIGLCQHGD